MSVKTESKYEILSPFPDECLRLFWDWMLEFKTQMVDDFTPKTFEEMVEKLRNDEQLGAKSYAIIQKGTVVGCVWGEHVGDQVYAGHLVFDRDALTPREKLASARLTMQKFFSDGARKIRWLALADNRAYRIFLRRMGADFEGLLKKETRRDGKLCDVILYASFPDGELE